MVLPPQSNNNDSTKVSTSERARSKIAADWAAAETVAAQILTGELRIGSLTGDALYFRAAGQALEPDGLERTIHSRYANS